MPRTRCLGGFIAAERDGLKLREDAALQRHIAEQSAFLADEVSWCVELDNFAFMQTRQPVVSLDARHDLTFVQYDEAIIISDRFQSVRHSEQQGVLEFLTNGGLDLGICLKVLECCEHDLQESSQLRTIELVASSIIMMLLRLNKARASETS